MELELASSIPLQKVVDAVRSGIVALHLAAPSMPTSISLGESRTGETCLHSTDSSERDTHNLADRTATELDTQILDNTIAPPRRAVNRFTDSIANQRVTPRSRRRRGRRNAIGLEGDRQRKSQKSSQHR